MADVTGDHSQDVMIALLPIMDDWCQIELPHMTLVYAGEIPNLPYTTFNELAKDAVVISQMKPPTLRVSGIEQYGDDPSKMVDVLLFRITPEVAAMRRVVERWNRSSFREFKPHATIGLAGSATRDMMPNYVAFNRILVAWGDEQLSFWFSNAVY